MEFKSLIIINCSKEKIHSSYEFLNDSELIDIYNSDSKNYEFNNKVLAFDLEGEDAQIKRSSGFEDVIAEMAPGIEILDKQAASWDK